LASATSSVMISAAGSALLVWRAHGPNSRSENLRWTTTLRVSGPDLPFKHAAQCLNRQA
jgi:hypothetical protein